MTDQAMLLWIIGVILTITGLAGLLLPVVPGAPLLFLGLFFVAWMSQLQCRRMGLSRAGPTC